MSTLKNYTQGMNFETWLSNIVNGLNNKYENKSISIKRQGQEGKALVKAIFASDDFDSVFCSVIYEEKEIMYSLLVAYKAGTLFYDDSTIEETIELLKEGFEIRKKELRELELEKLKEAEKLRLQQEEEYKAQLAEAKRKIKIEKMVKKMDSLKPTKLKITNYYEFIGWVARHLTSLTAEMPDYLENWFVKRFGNVPHKVIDSNRKTANGFTMKYSLSMCARFNENIPEIFKLKLSANNQNKRIINTIGFVLDLKENYGFEFGTTQNVDQIMNLIPLEHKADFLKGYEND